ncbi:MAG TPA: glycosyltransferase family 9 protein [Acidimicrobiales bacterium]
MSRPVLVAVRAAGLGDLLTAVPALRALADAFPGHRRVLAGPAPLAPLVALAGVADEVADTRWVDGVGALAPGLGGAGIGVNLHGRGPASTAALAALRPGRLVAYGLPGGPAWRDGEHEVARWCRLLAESGIPADPGRLDLPRPPVDPPPGAAGATLVHPGAASPARRWPADRFAAVARAEAGAGRPVVVTGSAAEAPLAAEVARRAGLAPSAVLAGRTDLMGLAAAVAAADRVVCGDTGVAHLATALGRPSVVLFGPTPPSAWGPPPDRPRHRVLWAGRVGDPHAAEPDPGLLEIGIDDVLAALDRLERVGEPA